MPFEIILEQLPAGIALSSAKPGDKVSVSTREFSSSEDGDTFIQRLESLCNQFLNRIPKEASVRPSKIDHMLVLIRKDKTATVYINELPILATMRLKHDKKQGDLISSDDIVDIKSLDLQNISIPNDVGLLFLFSIRWRKGLFFDFTCLHDGSKPRDYDLGALLGHYFGYLTYQERFKVNLDEWQRLFNQQWFLFVSFQSSTIREILNYVRNKWDVDDLLERISLEITNSLPGMLTRWTKNLLFQPHMEFFQRAADRYLEKDFVSATSILYPRIEGIMRSVHSSSGTVRKASPSNLIASVVNPAREQEYNGHGLNLLLPKMFSQYLEEVYFRDFDPTKPISLSRHSIAHGVADAKDYSLKAATIGLLIVDQMFYFLPT